MSPFCVICFSLSNRQIEAGGPIRDTNTAGPFSLRIIDVFKGGQFDSASMFIHEGKVSQTRLTQKQLIKVRLQKISVSISHFMERFSDQRNIQGTSLPRKLQVGPPVNNFPLW